MSNTVNEIVLRKVPEGDEIEERSLQLTKLEEELIDCQVRLLALQIDINVFEARYLETIGVLYAELDSVKAEIAEVISMLDPTNQEAYDKAVLFRTHAEETAREANYAKEQPPKPEFHPSDDLKKLIREAAKLMHPDLASSEDERLHRHEAMAKANSAYAEADEASLKGIIQDWKELHSSQEVGAEAELARITRKIDQVLEAISQVRSNIKSLQASDIGVLVAKSKKAKLQNRDILLDLAVNVKAEITDERKRLIVLLKERDQI